MAQKKTYIYWVHAGYNNEKVDDFFMYARNRTVAIDYCKEYYKDKKYSFYKTIKIGLSHVLRDTVIIEGYEAEKLRQAIAERGEKFSEREVQMPEFVKAEDM